MDDGQVNRRIERERFTGYEQARALKTQHLGCRGGCRNDDAGAVQGLSANVTEYIYLLGLDRDAAVPFAGQTQMRRER
jgi:hypothetical protein